MNAFPESVVSYQLSVISYLKLFTVYCLPYTEKTSGKSVVQNVEMELTAAGTVPELDRIPFYQSNESCFDTIFRCKSSKKKHFKSSLYLQITELKFNSRLMH